MTDLPHDLTAPLAAPQSFPEDRASPSAMEADVPHFESLYTAYLPRVYRYLRSHVADAVSAEDLTQQVFLQTLEGLPHYHERGVPISVWLFRIARHTLIDSYRHARLRATLPLDAVMALPARDAPEAEAIHHEELTRLRDLLVTLAPDQRELLTLRFAADLSAPEIAAVLGVRPATVRKRLSRLMQTLKERYHAR